MSAEVNATSPEPGAEPDRAGAQSVLNGGTEQGINEGTGQRFQSLEEKQTNGFSKEGDADSNVKSPSGI